MKCPDCYSIKVFPGTNEGDGKCAKCYGTGSPGFIESAVESFNILNDERPKCATCGGTGVCQTCRGSGVVHSPPPEREPSPTYSPPSSGGDGGITAIFGLIAFVVIAIVVLFSIIGVLISIPIWVGATAVAVIAGYLQSRKILARIPAEALAAAPIIQVWSKKRFWRKSTSKPQVDPAFLKQHIRWNPDLLITTGAAAVYAALAAGLLVLVNEQGLVQIMFAVAVLASVYLGWKSSRRMLEWKLAERIYAARQIPPGNTATFAQIAFGLSVAAAAILVVLLITTAVTLPQQLRDRRLQAANRPLPQRRVEPNSTPVASPPPRVQNPLSRSPISASRRPSVAPTNAPTFSPPAVARDPMQLFAERFQEIETNGSIGQLLELYAPTVAYFDNGQVDRAFIEKDKQDYSSRWIKRSQSRTGEIQVNQSGATASVTYPTHFRVENAKGDWIEGDADNSLQLAPNGGSFHVVAQQVRVKNRVKGSSTFSTQSGALSADAISAFVTQLMELEKSHQLDSILSRYAPRVAYFDNGVVDHAFIRKDKADYYARWPTISYELTGRINATQLGSNVWEVRAPTKFHVANQKGEWIDGDVTQALTIDTSGPSWLITAEKGEVTRREKGTGLPPAESSATTVARGSSQAIGGGAYRGKGSVYRIPDLKNLAGKSLSNAWLYGEFAFEQQRGNTAVCRTAATVIFVGKGTTKVNIEFDGGFSVSDRILNSMRDPQLPLTYTLRTPADNPIRLLRVRQNRDGTLEGWAKSPIGLDMQ